MEFFLVLFCLLYAVIGWGLARLVPFVDTEFCRDCTDNFVTIIAWPFILVFIALNRELTKEIRPKRDPQDDVSYATL